MRIFLRLLIYCMLANALPASAQEGLPVGSHPAALEFEHFPNKSYAVVWRNWNLVPVERIALTIGTTPQQVIQMAADMGLPPHRSITPDFKKRIYITVIRRNWHLLPYDQLLILLDMSEKELEFALKEDDFLYVKLGNLKPRCAPIQYEKPNAAAIQQLKTIRKTAQELYQSKAWAEAEEPFTFVAALTKINTTAPVINTPKDQLRYIYSYFGIFGDPLIDTLHDPYPEGLLAKLAERGVTGVWMHVVLNQLAPGGEQFPEFGVGHETRIANLKRIVQRAQKYGISIYLYMNEPRTMPPDFFKNRPEMEGATQGSFKAMCTAHPAVAEWMRSSLRFVFKSVPELGGVFTITASENHTHCASHGNQATCTRCSKREYAEIIADVNTIIEKGVHEGNPNAKVIIWDWGWHGHGLAPDIIERLPKNVWLMSVSEWAKNIERGGIPSRVGEYSISSVGPGSRSQQHWAWAKQAGLKTVAKVQFNNTWELSAVPWIPVSYLVARHAANLAKADIDGLMLSWSLGGYPSPNLEIAQSFSKQPKASVEQVLRALAVKRYGEDAAPHALKAWLHFSNAFEEFPYNVSTVYTAPMQYGPSNLLYPQPTGYKATMVGLPYDDLNSWRSIYPTEIFINQFQKLSDGWQRGLKYYDSMLVNATGVHLQNIREEQRIATTAWLHFSSTLHQSMFVLYRDSLAGMNPSLSQTKQLQKKIVDIIQQEIKNARQLFEVSVRDSRIGFEASNQYYYVNQDLVEKILNCNRLLKRYQ